MQRGEGLHEDPLSIHHLIVGVLSWSQSVCTVLKDNPESICRRPGCLRSIQLTH